MKMEEMDLNFPFRRLIENRNSCLDYFLANSKIFRLHAVLRDYRICDIYYKKNLDNVILYLVFPVHIFLVM